jgi:hypothetical protein
MPKPAKLSLAPTAVASKTPLPAPAVLPGTQTPLLAQSKYSTQYPLMQSFDVPPKKTSKAKPVVVKSKAKVAPPMKTTPALAN